MIIPDFLHSLIPRNISYLFQEKFCIVVGNLGTVVCYISIGNKIKYRAFIDNYTDKKQLNDVTEHLNQKPNIPIVLILDHDNQQYSHHQIPSVGILSANDLVEKRLQRTFPEKQMIKKKILLGKTKNKKEMQYLFIGYQRSEAIDFWTNFIMNVNNPISYTVLAPIELKKIISHYVDTKIPKDKSKKVTQDWIIVTLHSKACGYRQVVFLNNQLFLTRIIEVGDSEYDDVIAGNLELEVKNSLEYIKHIDGNHVIHDKSCEQHYHAIFILGTELGQYISSTIEDISQVHIFRPYDVAKQYNMAQVVLENDKFSDIMLASIISSRKPILPCFNKQSQLCYIAEIFTSMLKSILPVFTVYIIIQLALSGIVLWNKKSDLEQHVSELERVNNHLAHLESSNNITDIEKDSNIAEFVHIHKKLSGGILIEPNTIVNALLNVLPDYAVVDRYHWYIQTSGDKQQYITEKITTDLTLFNTGQGFQTLFNHLKTLKKLINEQFILFSIKYITSQNSITLDGGDGSLPMKIKLEKQHEIKY